jgi:membrane protease YdiL (CAAX protease family)
MPLAAQAVRQRLIRKQAMKTFVSRQPLLFALAAGVAGVLSQLWPFWIPGLALTVRLILARVSVAIVAVGLLTMLHWWHEAGFGWPESARVTLPYLPLAFVWLVPVLLGIAVRGIQVTAPGPILLALLVFLLGGFMEEAIFRGVILRALLPGGLLRANLVAASIFATAHLAGLAVGADPAASALQWVSTWLFGFAAVAALTYARNLWPLVIIHSLVNFGSYLITGDYFNTARPTAADAVVVVILMAVPAAVGWWLLRRASRLADSRSWLPNVTPTEAGRLAKGGQA